MGEGRVEPLSAWTCSRINDDSLAFLICSCQPPSPAHPPLTTHLRFINHSVLNSRMFINIQALFSTLVYTLHGMFSALVELKSSRRR